MTHRRVFSSFGELKTVMQQEEKERRAAFLLPAKVKTIQTAGAAHAHTDTRTRTHTHRHSFRKDYKPSNRGKNNACILSAFFNKQQTLLFSNTLQHYLFEPVCSAAGKEKLFCTSRVFALTAQTGLVNTFSTPFIIMLG